MDTLSPRMPRVQSRSHCFSWAHTRPVIAGRAFLSEISSYAAWYSPARTFAMNSVVGTCAGHDTEQ